MRPWRIYSLQEMGYQAWYCNGKYSRSIGSPIEDPSHHKMVIAERIGSGVIILSSGPMIDHTYYIYPGKSVTWVFGPFDSVRAVMSLLSGR